MSAVRTKDHLLNLINSAGNAQELMIVAETIRTILENTEGLWIEANYCYKASEIAQRLVTELSSCEFDANHWKTAKKLQEHRVSLSKLADYYNKLQQQRMNPVVEHCCAG
jgi:hypothetical protein